MTYYELKKLYGEPIKEIRGVDTDVAKIIVGEEPPYQSIQVSGDLLTVERGPTYTEQTSLQKAESGDQRRARELITEAVDTLAENEGADIDDVIESVVDNGIDRSVVSEQLEHLRRQGDVYEPTSGKLRTI